MNGWIDRAKEIGFDTAVSLDPGMLISQDCVREMCAENRCGAYHKNWTCPPACGTIPECQQKIRGFSQGLLLQSIGYMSKTIDSKCYRETECRHLRQLEILAEEIRKVYPHALCLGAGGCRICKTCAYPEPCRFPEKAMYSMEGYGLFVSRVCTDAGVAYHYGEKTIAYTGCILF